MNFVSVRIINVPDVQRLVRLLRRDHRHAP